MAKVAIRADNVNLPMWQFVLGSCDVVIKLETEEPKYPGDKQYKIIYALEGAGLPKGKVWIDCMAYNRGHNGSIVGFTDGMFDGWYTLPSGHEYIVKWYVTLAYRKI